MILILAGVAIFYGINNELTFSSGEEAARIYSYIAPISWSEPGTLSFIVWVENVGTGKGNLYARVIDRDLVGPHPDTGWSIVPITLPGRRMSTLVSFSVPGALGSSQPFHGRLQVAHKYDTDEWHVIDDYSDFTVLYEPSPPSPPPSPPSTFTVTVYILDGNTNKPVSGATVELTDTISKVTNDDGTVVFTNVDAGSYTISVSANGYKPTSRDATVDRNVVYVIHLSKEQVIPVIPGFEIITLFCAITITLMLTLWRKQQTN